MKEKVLILTEGEFLFLAAACGIRTIYGFELESVPVDTENMLQNLQKLTEKRLLFSENGSFRLQDPAKKIFEQIKDVKSTIEIHKRSGRSCIVYIGDCGVKVSFSENRYKMLEVQVIPINEIWNFLTEEGWIPE